MSSRATSSARRGLEQGVERAARLARAVDRPVEAHLDHVGQVLVAELEMRAACRGTRRRAGRSAVCLLRPLAVPSTGSPKPHHSQMRKPRPSGPPVDDRDPALAAEAPLERTPLPSLDGLELRRRRRGRRRRTSPSSRLRPGGSRPAPVGGARRRSRRSGSTKRPRSAWSLAPARRALVGDLLEAVAERAARIAHAPTRTSGHARSWRDDQAVAPPELLAGDGHRAGRVVGDRQS